MIDTLIQLVLDPEGVAGGAEQFVGPPLQIGEIQQALLLLDTLIVLDQPVTGQKPGLGELQRPLRGLLIENLQDGLAQRFMQLEKAALTRLSHGLGPLFARSQGPRLQRLGEEHLRQLLECRFEGAALQSMAEEIALGEVGLGLMKRQEFGILPQRLQPFG